VGRAGIRSDLMSTEHTHDERWIHVNSLLYSDRLCNPVRRHPTIDVFGRLEQCLSETQHLRHTGIQVTHGLCGNRPMKIA
jgi:hypothetical protein